MAKVLPFTPRPPRRPKVKIKVIRAEQGVGLRITLDTGHVKKP